MSTVTVVQFKDVQKTFKSNISITWVKYPNTCVCFLKVYFCLPPQIESYIKDNMKTEMVQLQRSAVHNHTAAMLEMGTSLLSQTAEQTRKLTNVETQVCSSQDQFHASLSEQSFFCVSLQCESTTAKNTCAALDIQSLFKYHANVFVAESFYDLCASMRHRGI